MRRKRLRKVLPQLARGLIRLHRGGKVHCDIKPSNILVTAEGRVVLVDFGLAVESESAEHSRQANLAGTAAYMAPEQSVGERPTPAADWYAVGVVLYEALTGRLPFRGKPMQILLEKQQQLPPPPRSLVRNVPADLDELCVDLLLREPEQRPTALAVLRRLGGDQKATLPERLSIGQDRVGIFAGRQRELKQLSRGLTSLLDDRAEAILLCGPSGIGKSALIRKFIELERAAHADLVVLQGRCYDREKVAFQAIDGLIDNLSRFWLQLLPTQAAKLVPRQAALLPRLFPVLGRVPALAKAPQGREFADPNEMRTQAFAALRETLQRLGERSLLILVLDDMQWADANTLFLLTDLMRPPDPPCLLLLLSTRPEGADRLAELVLSMDTSGDVVSLEALTPDDAADCARQLLGPEAADLASRLASDAAGNPFFISELAQYIKTMPGDHSELDTIRLDEILSQRIQALPDPARQVLEVVALAGAPVPRPALLDATGHSKAKLERELGVLGDLKFVRTSGQRDFIEPFHDRISDATLEGMPEVRRSTHHRALATALKGTANNEQLAFHWRGAGEHGRAAEHAHAAAEEALARLDFDRAATLFRLALDLGSYDPELSCVILSVLGETLANAGRPAEAARVFKEACQNAGPAVRLELHRRTAEEFLRGGYMEEGLQEMEKVLATIGMCLARTPQRALFSLILRRVWLAFRGLGWRERAIADVPQRVLTRIDICWSVVVGLGFGDSIRGVDYIARHTLYALRAGHPLRVGRALTSEAIYLAAQDSQRARRVSVLTGQLAASVDDPYLHACSSLVDSFVEYCIDNAWRNALRNLKEAEELFLTRCAAGWELDTTQLWCCFSLIYLGQFGELARFVPSYLLAAERRGDRYMAIALRTRANQVWLVRTGAESARRELEVAAESWDLSAAYQLRDFWALTASCEIALYNGQPTAASDRMSRELASLRRSKLLRMKLVDLEVTLLRARLELAGAAALPPDDGRGRSAAIRRARRHTRRIGRMRLPLAGAMQPLLAAGVANLEGDSEGATACLRQAVNELGKLETMLWANAAKRRLAEMVGGEEGAELSNQAETWMVGQGVRSPARITATLVPGWPEATGAKANS